ncbi:MAG: helix-turn-helix domain-containing protein [Solirubrobacterales bacterium]
MTCLRIICTLDWSQNMDLSKPSAVISSSLDAAVLSVLAGTTDRFTGREVARLAGRPPSSVQRALDRLVGQGLVNAREAGRAVLYKLNREHLAADAVIALAELRVELLRHLREEIGSWTVKPDHASLFGSAARGDGDTSSDIDLFVVRPAAVDEDDRRWRAQLDRLAERVHAWPGNHAGIAEVSAEEVERLRRERPAVVNDLHRDAVELAGQRLRTMLAPP